MPGAEGAEIISGVAALCMVCVVERRVSGRGDAPNPTGRLPPAPRSVLYISCAVPFSSPEDHMVLCGLFFIRFPQRAWRALRCAFSFIFRSQSVGGRTAAPAADARVNRACGYP